MGRRAAGGRDDGSLDAEALIAAVEDDPAGREALAAAEAARRPTDLVDTAAALGARALRARRAEAAHRAAGQLVLAGELVADGPGRLRLPGFGGSTWRAVALLRAGGGGPEGLLAEAVAAEPGADLGAAAPPFLSGLRAAPRLLGAARRIHLFEAVRQDARNALLAASAALVSATDAGYENGARILRAECAALERRIDEIDAAIAAAWDAGVREAAALGPR